MPDFKYPAIDEAKQEIRVIPARLDGELEYDYIVISLSDRPKYLALSYSNTEREYFTPGIFIDALCINQENVRGRSTQVALMSSIYGQAVDVIVWFGLEPQWVTKLLRKVPAVLDRSKLDWCLLGKASESLREVTYTRDTIVRGISMHEYWNRIWTVQEFLKPRNLTLKAGCISCGDGAFCFAASQCSDANTAQQGSHNQRRFRRSRAVLDRRSFDSESFTDARRTNNQFWEYTGIRFRGENVNIPISLAIKTFGKQRSSETKDRVYGLLGLTESKIVPDYSLSPLQIYTQALHEGLEKARVADDMVEHLALALHLSGRHERTVVLLVALLSLMSTDYSDNQIMLSLLPTIEHIWNSPSQHSTLPAPGADEFLEMDCSLVQELERLLRRVRTITYRKGARVVSSSHDAALVECVRLMNEFRAERDVVATEQARLKSFGPNSTQRRLQDILNHRYSPSRERRDRLDKEAEEQWLVTRLHEEFTRAPSLLLPDYRVQKGMSNVFEKYSKRY
ncbi:WD repeat-containing protein jip5 [Elasticomyces elasticus]|nr:WD repeat-containing protein jip5 [Elasticomyces elasticus]